MNRKKIDLQKKIQKKSKGEVSKPSALRAEHNIWALSDQTLKDAQNQYITVLEPWGPPICPHEGNMYAI